MKPLPQKMLDFLEEISLLTKVRTSSLRNLRNSSGEEENTTRNNKHKSPSFIGWSSLWLNQPI